MRSLSDTCVCAFVRLCVCAFVRLCVCVREGERAFARRAHPHTTHQPTNASGKILLGGRDDALANFLERAADQSAGCAGVTTTAEPASKFVDVDTARAAKGCLHFSVAEIAEEDR